MLSEDSGGRVSNAWAICLSDRDNRAKALLIPDRHQVCMGRVERGNPPGDEPASH